MAHHLLKEEYMGICASALLQHVKSRVCSEDDRAVTE